MRSREWFERNTEAIDSCMFVTNGFMVGAGRVARQRDGGRIDHYDPMPRDSALYQALLRIVERGGDLSLAFITYRGKLVSQGLLRSGV